MLIFYSVINRVRKALRQEAVISEDLPVYTSKRNEGIDLREESVEDRVSSVEIAGSQGDNLP